MSFTRIPSIGSVVTAGSRSHAATRIPLALQHQHRLRHCQHQYRHSPLVRAEAADKAASGKVPATSSTEHVPAKSSAEKPVAKASAEKATTEKPAAKAPAEKPAEKATAEKPAATTPVAKPAGTASVEKAQAKASTEKTSDTASTKASEQPAQQPAAAAQGTEAPKAEALSPPDDSTTTLITSTEVPPFIPRDDLVDQLVSWARIEAGENGLQNFGLPMNVTSTYKGDGADKVLWGFQVAIFKEGVKLTDLAVKFDDDVAIKYEWVGRGPDGFPTQEGNAEEVAGKNLQIWKLDKNKVDEDLRSAIRAFCTGLVAALNKYYAFGSVFKEEN